MQPTPRRITAWLETAPTGVLTAYAVCFSFATYFAMFAFRKPFAAASYEGASWFGGTVGLKSALVIGQVAGYGFAKFIGMKFISETRRRWRAPGPTPPRSRQRWRAAAGGASWGR